MNLINRSQSTHKHIIRFCDLSILEESTSSILKTFEGFISLDNCTALDFQKYNFRELIRFNDDVRVKDSKALCIALSDIHMLPLALYYFDKSLIDVVIPLSSRIDEIKLDILKKLRGDYTLSKHGALDDCEFYILACLSKGFSQKEISRQLKKPVKTIYFKIAIISKKMQLRSWRDLFI